jgi:broad specificity phosphatase PhoE
MAEIYLVRHGQASFGTDNYDRLSVLGHRQAEVAGEYLQKVGVKVDAIYAGTLVRQNETAEGVRKIYAANGSPLPEVIQDVGFNEVQNDLQIHALAPILAEFDADIQDNAAKAFNDSKAMQKMIRSVFQHWVSLGDEPGHESLESWNEYSARVQAGMKRVITEQGAGKTTAVFSSGGTIATIAAAVLGLPPSGVYQLFEQVVNCSVTRLVYSGNKITMSYFNDHGYLKLMATDQDDNGLITFR